MKYFSFFKYIYILLALFTFSGSSFGVEVRFDAIYGYDLNANSLAVEQNGVGQERYAYDEVRNFIHYGIQRPSSVLNQVNIEYESDYRLYYGTTNLCYRCINYSVENLQEKTLDGSFFASIGFGNASKGVDPSTIRFTQSSVGNTINTPNGKRPLRKLVKDLSGGRTSADDLPPIRVFDNNGALTTLDNRRLKAFQVAGKPINTVPATAKEIANDAFKFSSKNGGTSVKVRGGGL